MGLSSKWTHFFEVFMIDYLKDLGNGLEILLIIVVYNTVSSVPMDHIQDRFIANIEVTFICIVLYYSVIHITTLLIRQTRIK
jgi:hypothetical protein